VVTDHWKVYGRHLYCRYDYENVGSDGANKLMEHLRGLDKVEEFSYVDPVDGSVSSRQGLILRFSDCERAVFRLSGTGSEGATVRVYLERFEEGGGDGGDAIEALGGLGDKAIAISKLEVFVGRSEPTVRT